MAKPANVKQGYWFPSDKTPQKSQQPSQPQQPATGTGTGAASPILVKNEYECQQICNQQNGTCKQARVERVDATEQVLTLDQAQAYCDSKANCAGFRRKWV